MFRYKRYSLEWWSFIFWNYSISNKKWGLCECYKLPFVELFIGKAWW